MSNLRKLLFLIVPFLVFAGNSTISGGSENPLKTDLLYRLKLYLDLQTPKREILKNYSNQTAEFLYTVFQEVNKSLKEKLLSEDTELLFQNGLPSDYTITYTFPRAYIKEISRTVEINGNRYTKLGLKIDIDLALYVFKTAVPPRLVFYKVYSYRKYIPPEGKYLPIYTSLAEFIGKSFALQIERDLQKFIKKEKAKLEFYKKIR